MSTINGVFFSLLRRVTFLPEWVIVGFRNFAWGLKSQKNKIWGKKKLGDPSALGGFREKNKKCIELPEISASVDGGLRGGSSVRFI